MKQVKYIKNDSRPISCLKFSETGNYIAVGNMDGLVHIRNSFDYQMVDGTKKKHAENAIISIDWSLGDQYIRFEDCERNFTIHRSHEGTILHTDLHVLEYEHIRWASVDCYSSWSVKPSLSIFTFF